MTRTSLRHTALYLRSLARFEEGIAHMREAMRINPYHPEWYWIDSR